MNQPSSTMKLRNQANAIEALDQARIALRVGHAAQALIHVMESRRLDPDHLDALLLCARIQLSLHRPADAMATLDLASLVDQAGDHSFDLQLLRAQSLSAAGRHSESLGLLEQLIKQCPTDTYLRRLAAAAAQSCSQIDTAITHLQSIIKLDASDDISIRTLAQLLSTRDPQSSIDLLQPENSVRRDAMQWQTAQWMKQAGRQRDAEETYRQLLAERPEDGSLWLEAAAHASQNGSLDVAIERYQHALALRLADPLATRVSLARTFMHAGRFDQAVWHWWRATMLDGNHPEIWAGLIVSAHCCNRAHLIELAQKRFEPLCDEDERIFLLTESWLDAGAGEVIHRVTEPSQPPVATASPLTWILEQSAQVLSTQIVRKPGWADTLYHTAICEAALGDDESAREHVQAALDINPNYKAATTLAARLPKAA